MAMPALKLNRLSGWLLAAALVLPSLIGWLPMPMRVQQAVAATTQTAQDATQRLLSDLMVLCTPYGLRLVGQHGEPATPTGEAAHDACVLCGLAAGASIGVLDGIVALAPSNAAAAVGNAAMPGAAPHASHDPRPPSRGPPN